jgi:toxin ParE1/3/4
VSARYRLAPLARADLDDIWLYVAQHASPQTADRLIDAITQPFAFLARYPNAGRPRDDLGLDVRSFPVRNYIIYYRSTADEGVLIARVLHGSRDELAAWLA